jgi:dCTP deaminase
MMIRKFLEDMIKDVLKVSSTGVLTDEEITKLCIDYQRPMIEPFVSSQIKDRLSTTCVDLPCSKPLREKIISYGTSSMGYDVRLADKFKIFTNVYGAVIDPLKMPDDAYIDHEGEYVVIPPNSYVLGHTIEYFRMPDDVMAMCVGKSTYARAGCAVNVTPIEPGFEGNVVIEVANQTTLPMKVYSNMGISQFVFFRSVSKCRTSYADRKGKYQGQRGIQTALV